MHLSNFKIFYFISEFNPDHIIKIDKNINLIFRNYKKKFNDNFFKSLKNFCHSNKYKIYLANNIKLAHSHGFDGAYLPSFNKKMNVIKNCRKNFKILGSAHNLKEILEKEKQKVDFLFISPIFKKEGYKNLGLYKFMNLSKYAKCNVVALGGINSLNIKKLKLIKINKFASIKYIKNLYEK